MSVESFIARRYLKSKKRTGFISFTTFFSFIVIFLGVACITVILSIMNGFEGVVIDRFLAIDSHVRIFSSGEESIQNKNDVENILQSQQEITGYSPYVMEKAMLDLPERGYRRIVNFKGIDLGSVHQVSLIRQKVIIGSDDFTGDGVTNRRRGIIIGKGVADNLAATIGDEIRVFNPKGAARLMGTPSVRIFIVTGIFESEISELDNYYVFADIAAAQRLYRLRNSVTGYDINTRDVNQSAELATRLKEKLGEGYSVRTWFELHKNLYNSMQLEKWAALIVLSLMILVASFSIASALIMMVLEKRKEIGILKSFGYPDKSIKKIFVTNGLIIGLSGTFLGLFVGFSVTWMQQAYGFIKLPAAIYIIDSLPVSIQYFDFIIVGIISVIMVLAAAFYPSNTAAKMMPSKALRYE